jgi:carboxypeptidase C (cathepsin A)
MNDLYDALSNAFLTRFPEFKKRELWVAGESYAGIYVPMITWKLMVE